ncbi:MAG: hypothetical protein ACQKBV_12110 [Puniceicoccales bacterium]
MPSPINLTDKLATQRPAPTHRMAKARFPEPLKKKAERRLTLDIFSGIVYSLLAIAVAGQVALLVGYY